MCTRIITIAQLIIAELVYCIVVVKLEDRGTRNMADEKLKQTFFSSEYGQSYLLQPGLGGSNGSSTRSLSAESTLIARQSGTYGANANRNETSITDKGYEGGTGETDKTQLLSEKIRKKKQGNTNTQVLLVLIRGLQGCMTM